MPTRRTMLAVCAALLVFSACSSSHSSSKATKQLAHVKAPRGTWAGALTGTDIYLAVVADGDQVLAYACDHGRTSEWFAGSEDGPDLVLHSHNATLQVALDASAHGTITLAHRPQQQFDLAATNAPALYRAEGGDVTHGVLAGWIKLADGSTRGSLQTGTRTSSLSTVTSAPTLQTNVLISSTDLPTLNLGPEAMTPDTLGTPVVLPGLFRWVAMGDSFASGEGNPTQPISDPSQPENFAGLVWAIDNSDFVPFDSSTVPITPTQEARDTTTCHRSDKAPSPKANNILKGLYPDVVFQFGFVACGGAETTALTTNGYLGPDATPASRNNIAPLAQPAQIDRAAAFAGTTGLDALYMSIGGNDAGFGELVPDCISPLEGDCADKWGGSNGLLAQRLSAMPDEYKAVNTKLHNAFGPSLPSVFISEYPNPLDDGVVNSGAINPVCLGDDYLRHGEIGIGAFDDILKNNISEHEADFAYGIAAQINAQVDAAAHNFSWNIVDAHVAASLGHGLCASDPWFNLNSAGLHTQGRDNTAGIPFSDGLLHPNDKGQLAYANAIVARMRRFVDQKILQGLQPPTNVRIAAAQNGGNITVHWNDRAIGENAFDIEVTPVDQQAVLSMSYPANVIKLASGGYIQRLAGRNLQEYVHFPNHKGLYSYRVRACNTEITTTPPQTTPSCGAYSAPTTGANFFPATSTGLNFTTGTARVLSKFNIASTVQTSTLNWATQPEALEYVVRVAPAAGTTGTTTDVRMTTTSFDLGATTDAKTHQYQVAACNRVGCSIFTTPPISP